ncbi:MAG: class I SAM-dependent methyltransferase [Mesorhizobium sp.]|uniref:class I SAM-dependent methyltransferase n=1 Tax=Mesorhizobium sp. TaxID=1871066 RepID=UPI000FE6F8EF|nr:class I SAM-dependent methyltransferase [Mesorhizobium sp.]RWM05325.1 MAG: class I SAM-dependent methyltransferase [Mesorhizobium sp.]TIO51844.1 MAG: class I SAM-dependent methyltransferase [Mesorhizobium sp.]TIO58069.1 MAG: class I SAM-dependent methyltransferase [Mesorhizobium sp.]TJV59069.1 MAG: class I SAM-dependent methyltransferase [Mesorhizobium sp.]
MASASTESGLATTDNGAAGAQDMFNSELETYRRIIGANLMFHQEIYHLLRDLLVEQAPASFRFLDVACGDASASAAMLRTTAIGNYVGIDLSEASLRLAARELDALPCPVELRCCDFAPAMAKWSEPVDVIWIGMSLHHLPTAAKARLMRNAHRALGGMGLFVIWEPALFEGEDRAAWLARFSLLRDKWSAVSDEEFASMERHMLLADFPETSRTWLRLGREAGFSHAEDIFLMPNRMGRVFRYWN